ncbi:MAG: cysteine synthase A [Deltaproteobacteria bacterium]|nr:cysteine synthase A [Deltaproteobacteria bacterium]
MESTSTTQGFCGTIGNTPLIRLDTLSDATGCEILGKAEFLNPGGSVKDRAALAIIEDAERAGALRPGGVVVEGTAGNTGIGLALVANAKGYRSIIVVPETQSPEKFELLRAIGAEVRAVAPAPYSEPGNYNHVARRIAEETPGGFWANQFDNVANRNMHYRTTGPEIWAQTGGRVTAFVAAVGTGGTLAGVSRYLKEKNAAVRTVCADPFGASMWSWIKKGNLDDDEGDSVTEGIGQGRITKNFEGAPIDDAYRIGDEVILELNHYLVKREGLLLGSSSAINVCGALKLARERGPGQVIVTVLCDGGGRYLSRLYNPAWLAEKKLTPKGLSLDELLARL